MPSDVGAAVAETERAIRRLQALKLRLVAAAESSLAPLSAGHRTTGSWLAALSHSGPAAAAREARLAGDLEHDLPATATALADGTVSTEHARVIADATRSLPDGLSLDQVAIVEADLVGQAKRSDPARLRQHARRAIAAIEPDTQAVDAHENALLEREEDAARDRARLTLHDNGDGTTTGHFTVPTLAAAILRKVLDAMTAPRAHHLHRERGTGRHGRLDPAHERGLAFIQVLEHLPTDHLHSPVAATVVVTLDLETLHEQLKAAHLDTGDIVSAAEARRLACHAGLVPAVLNTGSVPLDLGRRTRLFSEAATFICIFSP